MSPGSLPFSFNVRLQFNEAFTSLFVVEMAIKIGLLGPVGFFSDGYNIFDFTITSLGLIEITIKVPLGFSTD